VTLTEQVVSGLEGVLACESSVCFIDGQAGVLEYRGYNIHDIAEKLPFADLVFLL
jgi:citrate synthase